MDITFVGFTPDFLSKFVLSRFPIFLIEAFSTNLQIKKNYLSLASITLNKNHAFVSAKYGNLEDQKRSSAFL